MEGQMVGQNLFYRNLPITARFQTNLQNISRIKGTYHFAQIGANMVKQKFFWKKKTMFLMYVWCSLVKEAATVDIEKVKHL